jgi:uncharacterized protein
MIVLGLEINLLTLFTERRRPRPLKRATPILLAWSVPGALAGVAVLRALDAVALQILVSVGVLATLAARHVTRGAHVPRWAAPAAGFVAGALSTSTTTAGPPLLVYLLGRGIEPEQVRDTATACFMGLGLIGAAALLVTGTDAVPDAETMAWLVPVVAVGHLAGRPVFAKLAGGGRYEPVVTGVLLVAVAVGLAGAVT